MDAIQNSTVHFAMKQNKQLLIALVKPLFQYGKKGANWDINNTGGYHHDVP